MSEAWENFCDWSPWNAMDGLVWFEGLILAAMVLSGFLGFWIIASLA
jgi:hypothetical protein